MIECKFCMRTFDVDERLSECPSCGALLPRLPKSAASSQSQVHSSTVTNAVSAPVAKPAAPAVRAAPVSRAAIGTTQAKTALPSITKPKVEIGSPHTAKAGGEDEPIRWGKLSIYWTGITGFYLFLAMVAQDIAGFSFLLSLFLGGVLLSQRGACQRRGDMNLLTHTSAWEVIISCVCLLLMLSMYALERYVLFGGFLGLTLACYYPAWKRLRIYGRTEEHPNAPPD